jgi:quercetin dioxygenase-like cupin family protein
VCAQRWARVPIWRRESSAFWRHFDNGTRTLRRFCLLAVNGTALAHAERQPMAFPLIRLYTGDDGESHFEESTLELPKIAGSAHRSQSWQTTEMRFAESPAGSTLDWHRARVRQYAITLSGTLEFETRLDETFTIDPGTILLAEDTEGGGDKWRLVDDQAWRRVYVGPK